MTVLWSPRAKKELQEFSKEKRDIVVEFDEKGRGDVKNIAEGLWRLRVGEYRVYYHQEKYKTYVLRVTHRKHAYRESLIKALRHEIGEI